MRSSRRTFLGTGALAVLGSTALPRTSIAQATPTRRSLGQLAPDDPVLQTLRAGVRLLKARPAGDPLNWSNLANIHLNFCPHGNWFFLPWHRAYLAMYERLIRTVTGSPQFALPYWDWTADRRLPAAFAQASFGGQPNPLFEPSRTISPTLGLPDNMVGPGVISGILSQTDFEIFASSRPQGQNSTASSWQRAPGSQGPMESNPHNRVHGTVGGVMQNFRSPVDPIFLMHHGNIDRLWNVWNQRCRANTSSPLWRQFSFVNNFRQPSGGLYSIGVSSLLSTTANGYRYAPQPSAPCGAVAQRPDTVLRPFVLPSGVDPATRAGAVAGRGPAAARLRVSVEVGRTAEPMRVLEVPVALPRRALQDLGAPRATARGGAATDGPTSAATAGQILAFVDDVPTPPGNATEVRIFLDCDYLGVDTPASDPHYVTTFSFFGRPGDHAEHGGPSGAGGKVSFTLDLTPTVQALQRLQPSPGDALRLQFLPVPLPGAPASLVAPITPGRVEIMVR